MFNFSIIKKYEDKLAKNGIILETIPESDNLLTIEIIEVPKQLHNKGFGTKILNNLCNWADKNNIILQLRPAASSTHSRLRLINFYSKFGFVENKNENKRKDYQYMYRVPKEQFQLAESFIQKILLESELDDQNNFDINSIFQPNPNQKKRYKENLEKNLTKIKLGLEKINKTFESNQWESDEEEEFLESFYKSWVELDLEKDPIRIRLCNVDFKPIGHFNLSSKAFFFSPRIILGKKVTESFLEKLFIKYFNLKDFCVVSNY